MSTEERQQDVEFNHDIFLSQYEKDPFADQVYRFLTGHRYGVFYHREDIANDGTNELTAGLLLELRRSRALVVAFSSLGILERTWIVREIEEFQKDLANRTTDSDAPDVERHIYFVASAAAAGELAEFRARAMQNPELKESRLYEMLHDRIIYRVDKTPDRRALLKALTVSTHRPVRMVFGYSTPVMLGVAASCAVAGTALGWLWGAGYFEPQKMQVVVATSDARTDVAHTIANAINVNTDRMEAVVSVKRTPDLQRYLAEPQDNDENIVKLGITPAGLRLDDGGPSVVRLAPLYREYTHGVVNRGELANAACGLASHDESTVEGLAIDAVLCADEEDTAACMGALREICDELLGYPHVHDWPVDPLFAPMVDTVLQHLGESDRRAISLRTVATVGHLAGALPIIADDSPAIVVRYARNSEGWRSRVIEAAVMDYLVEEFQADPDMAISVEVQDQIHARAALDEGETLVGFFVGKACPELLKTLATPTNGNHRFAIVDLDIGDGGIIRAAEHSTLFRYELARDSVGGERDCFTQTGDVAATDVHLIGEAGIDRSTMAVLREALTGDTISSAKQRIAQDPGSSHLDNFAEAMLWYGTTSQLAEAEKGGFRLFARDARLDDRAAEPPEG